MNVRKLSTKGHVQTRKLWERVFIEDGQAFLDYYYGLVADHNQIYGIEADGAVQSMLHLNPYIVQLNEQQRRVHYIVGVATDPKFRRQGYMGGLLRASIKDMYCRNEPFTFLMPAAESIYSPYDFVTICNQIHYQYEGNYNEVGLPDVEGYDISYGNQKDCRELSKLAMEIIPETYIVYTFRDVAYYERLIKEQECQNGGIALIKKNGELIGYFLTAKEAHMQVRELIVRAEHEAVKDLMNLKVKENPKMMIRIIHLTELFKCIKPRKPFEIKIEVLDPIIEENTGIFHVQGTDEGILCSRISSQVNYETAIPIAELSGVLFGQELLNGLSAIHRLFPVLLNEIV